MPRLTVSLLLAVCCGARSFSGRLLFAMFCAARRFSGRVLLSVFCTVAGCAHEPTPETPLPGVPEASEPPAPQAAGLQRGLATYYATRLRGMRTANGERYDPRQMTAAHRSLPFGTWVEVRRVDAPTRAVVVRINDRGPYGRDRIVDLSRRAAQELGILSEGKVAVELRVVAPPPSATR